MEEVIDFILKGLYADDDNKIDFSILKLQVMESLGVDLGGRQGTALIHMLTTNELCTQTLFMGEPTLELTKNAKEIIIKYKTYTNYLESEKKRDRNMFNKIQERIFDTFRKQKARSNHSIMLRIFNFSVIPDLLPPEQDKFNDAANELVNDGYLIYEKDPIECFILTEKGYKRIYDKDVSVGKDENVIEPETLPIVVILTAIEEEYITVHKHLTRIKKEKIGGTIYEKGIFLYKGKNIADVVIRECGDSNVNAALESERAINNFKPDCMLFVGIAGSIKPQDFGLGDVIFPTKICYYEKGKAEKDGFQVRPECVSPEYTLAELAKYERRNVEWKTLILTKSDKIENVKANIGTIASGEKILEHIKSNLGQLIKGSYNDTAAIEMEGFGFSSAIARQGIEKKIKYGVIRGISDVVELKEHEGGTENRRPDNAKAFAADTAAAFAYWLVYKMYEESPITRSEENKSTVTEKSRNEELEERKIRSSVKPILKIHGGISMGFKGELQLNLHNKGERASLKNFRIVEGDLVLHNEHLPYELDKHSERKIFLKTIDRGNSNGAKYKLEIEYEDALNFKYISTIEGTGINCKLIETKEL